MKLNNSNYYSDEANMRYMSVSQYKSFRSCEAKAMAELRGEIESEKTTALLVGSYVDAYFEGTLEQFKEEHPEIISSRGATKGELKADYKHAETIIARIESDPLFMAYMSGKKQIIETAELFGCEWKIKMDVLNEDNPAVEDSIVDLKIMKDMSRTWHNGVYGSFVEAWDYDLQGGVYQRIHELKTGRHLPFRIGCATKEDVPNIELISIPDWRLDECLEDVEKHLPRVLAVKSGSVKPNRCGCCDYCKATKVLKEPLDFQLVGMTAEQIEEAKGTV